METFFPEISIEVEPVQLMHQLLMQLTTKPPTKIHPTLFVGTALENILDWLESFNQITTHNVWNHQKQLQVIPAYLRTQLSFLLIFMGANQI